MGVCTISFNLNVFNFNGAIIDLDGCVIKTSADIINHADLIMEVMHKGNAHNFPLDLAFVDALPIAMEAPYIVGA